MPRKDETPVCEPFPWKVMNGTMQECHVVIREQADEPTVHLVAHHQNGQKYNVTYFHEDELDKIINALTAAQRKLHSRKR